MNEPLHSDLHNRSHPVTENMALQRKIWRFERVGWYVLIVVIGLTLAGLFSKGPISTRQVISADGQLKIEYQRFLRNGSSDALVIHLQGKAREPLEIEVSGELLQGFEVEMLQPQPLKASTSGEGMRLWVLSDSNGLAVLHLTLRSDGVGSFDSQVSTPGGAPLRFTQFIYP